MQSEWDDPVKYEKMRQDTHNAIKRLRDDLNHETYFRGWQPVTFESKLTDYDKAFLVGLKIGLK